MVLFDVHAPDPAFMAVFPILLASKTDGADQLSCGKRAKHKTIRVRRIEPCGDHFESSRAMFFRRRAECKWFALQRFHSKMPEGFRILRGERTNLHSHLASV